MARFYVEETWRDGGVDVELYRVKQMTPEQAARMIERGMLRPDDEQFERVQIGEFVVDYPDGGFPKKVRRAALDWLTEHAGRTDADSIEIQIATKDALEVLDRITAAFSS